ncbi:uncharacterized protein LODBEIA_P44710 [Lodderomyces beijingensis]|uniref:Membrane protein PTM1 n=1 Tax=Lodderomyces beijingensis TaxID=1775926 RepID=A0ABP0ZV47_9ASCO
MRVLSILLLVAGTLANLARFDDNSYSQVCAGLYSKKDWGGSFKPHIGMSLQKYGDHQFNAKEPDSANVDGVSVSYIIFEYKDLVNIGAPLGDGRFKFICDDYAVDELKVCSEEQKGQFIVNSNSTNSTILTSELTQLGPANIQYPINVTGYYCVSTFSKHDDAQYRGTINFQNAFGNLNASEIPKLPGYGIMTLCYAITLALFGFQFFKKRKQNQILPLQRYLLAMLGFLTFDTLVVWSYYDCINRVQSPTNGLVIAYMVFMAICNAVKITFAFFLLLCIALGYGVVKLKLNKKTMFWCKILAGCNFAASLVYLIFNYYTGSSSALVSSDSIDTVGAGSFLGLLPLIPISIVLSIYYVTILSSIRTTTQNLHQQRQIIKLQLYQNLFRIIFFAIILTFLGLTLSSFIYLSMSTTEMFEQHWKSSFFIFDFWPSVVFFFVFVIIAWLWRPTETSYMLAVSQQLSTGGGGGGDDDDDPENPNYQNSGAGDFELDDLSLMSHDDDDDEEEGHAGNVAGRDRVQRDSLELGGGADHQSIQKKPPNHEDDQASTFSAPPAYAEGTSNSVPSGGEENGVTLFDLGEGEDSDIEEDDRLSKKR